MFTRMGDRFSTWDVSNGLQSIIPTLLTSSVAGYPFCLPDMIGKAFCQITLPLDFPRLGMALAIPMP